MAGSGAEPTPECPTVDACERRFVLRIVRRLPTRAAPSHSPADEGRHQIILNNNSQSAFSETAVRADHSVARLGHQDFGSQIRCARFPPEQAQAVMQKRVRGIAGEHDAGFGGHRDAGRRDMADVQRGGDGASGLRANVSRPGPFSRDYTHRVSIADRSWMFQTRSAGVVSSGSIVVRAMTSSAPARFCAPARIQQPTRSCGR